MSEIDYSCVKDQLIHDCMKGKFETTLMNLIDFSKDMTEIDKIIDPRMKSYFREADLLATYFNPDYEPFVPDEGLTKEDLNKQKCSCLKLLATYKLQGDTIAFLDTVRSIEDANDKLDQMINDYYALCNKIQKYYIPEEDEEDDDKNCPE